MPELRSCYFCGDPGESLGTYAVIPPRLNPTDEEQRTVVLCSACQEKLVRVMEPLVERATASSATTTGPGADSGATASAGGSPPDATTAPSEDDAGDEPGIQPSDRGVTIPSSDAGGADGSGVDGGDAPGDDGDDGAGVGEADDDDPLGGVDIDGASADASSAGTDDGSTGQETAAPGREAEAVGAETADQRDARDGELPDEYRKVMRLIENREFPMPRADLEVVVTSAYGLEDDQCRRILDAAIERGVLVEDGAELDRP